MPVTDIFSLEQAKQLVIASILARNPEIDLHEGSPQYDLLVRPFLNMITRIVDLLATAERKRTLLNVDEMTELEADAVADRYFTYRTGGEKATGSVRLRFTERRDVNLARGAAIRSGPQNYFPTQDYFVSSQDLVHDAVKGQYYTDVVVVAENVGPEYERGTGSPFTVDLFAASLTFVEAIAVGPVSGGAAKETNVELYERAQRNQVQRNLVSSLSIEAVLTERFPNTVQRVSVIGHQDPEMLRDLKTVLDPVLGQMQIHLGGHTDVYVKTPLVRETIEVILPADEPVIDLAPYHPVLKIHSVRVKDQEDLAPFWAITDQDPLLRYSALDKSKLFVDPAAADQTILVDMTRAPEVKTLHDFCQEGAVRLTLASVLVRHMIPVWLSANIYVEGGKDLDAEMRAAVDGYIAQLSLEEPVVVSKITEALHQAGVAGVHQDYEIEAEVILGDGQRIEATSATALAVTSAEFPEAADTGFSARVAFFASEGIVITNVD